MKIVAERPPNYDQIVEAFPEAAGPGVIFTYGDTIYNPTGEDLSPWLRAHEGVHYSQQTNDRAKIEAWWASYIADPEFRLKQEIPGHRAEYRNFCTFERDRNRRSIALHAIASRLASPLYGGLLTVGQAKMKVLA